jgi:glycosyltransferase involved in cell wall biosynthesis
MRVLCLTVGPDSEPSSRFRVHQWLGPLRALGIEVEVRPRADRRYLELGYGLRTLPAPLRAARVALQLAAVTLRRARDLWDARRYDLLWLQKETLPFGLQALARLLRLRIVFDFDDAIHLRADLAHGMGRGLRRLGDTILRRDRSLPRLLARCALVVAGSPNLARYAREHAADVRLVPTVVDAQRYRVRSAPGDGPLTIGWIGAPPNVVYLEPLRPVFQSLARRFELRLLVGGPSRFDCPGVRVECRPWRHYASTEEEAADLLGFDIGIMPLRDDPFAAGKCALKAIQYMAAGIPVVASPVGVNAEVVGDGECGLLASTPEEWEHALARLLADAALRARLGAAGRERALARYSIRAALPDLAAALRDAAGPTAVTREPVGSAAPAR